jgi:Ser/Thr protein kinase RdoA (MazF antagonist)
MEDLVAAASKWIGRPLEADGQLDGGEEADVWAASSDRQRFVIHVSAPWRRRSEVAWAHAVSTQAAAAVPEAVAPISVRGETSFSWNGRLVAVFRYVDGEPLDREDAEQVADAGRLLARIHAALLKWQPTQPHQ